MITQQQQLKTKYSYLLQNLKKPSLQNFSKFKQNQVYRKGQKIHKLQNPNITRKDLRIFSRSLKKKIEIKSQELKNSKQNNRKSDSHEIHRKLINPKFQEIQSVIQKKRVLVIRKRSVKTNIQQNNQIFLSCSKKVNQLVKFKNKSFGLQYFTPQKQLKNSYPYIQKGIDALKKPYLAQNGSGFYRSLYHENIQRDNQEKIQRDNQKRRITKINFYQDRLKKYNIQPESRGQYLCTEYKQQPVKIKKRCEYYIKKNDYNGLPQRSKTQEFDRIEILCGWDIDNQYQQKNLEDFNQINNLKQQ